MGQLAMTGVSRTAWRLPRAARRAIPVIGFLFVTAVILGIHASRSHSELPFSRKGSLAVSAARGPDIVRDEPTAENATFKLTEQERRGKQIYTTGSSPSGATLTAVLGSSTSEIPAAALTCVNCHRNDGRGDPEGGITPSNIRWDELTKPYGSVAGRGRTRPPYNAALVRRSITMGLDSAGAQLDRAMPRYRMTQTDVADLVAYLMVLGRELDPGLHADRLRIGVIVAPSPLYPEMSGAVRAVLTAFVSELNRAGGIYQREIDLCFAESPARREDRAVAAVEFVKREQVFALAASFIGGAEGDVARGLAEEGVPLVGAQTLYPQVEFPLNRHVFYLSAGLEGQCRALLRFAQERSRPGQVRSALLLFPRDEEPSDASAANAGLAELRRSIRAGCVELRWELQECASPARGIDVGDWAGRLVAMRPAVVFSLLTAEQSLQFLRATASHDWHPDCFLFGHLAGRQLLEAPSRFDRRIFLAFGNVPSQQPLGMHEYGALADQFGLPTFDLAAQFESLAAMKILVHALQRAGASVNRERLIQQLETLQDYRTCFAPAVTFGPNRRSGASGAYIVTTDLIKKKLVCVSDWVEGSATLQPDK
jgi:ABC-type branched-subunit amino acid transport system substrate-binding protein